MNKQKTIAFIGAGNMARAMIAGLLKNGFDPAHIWASSPNIQKHEAFQSTLCIHTTNNNVEAAENADVIVFSVKPWMMESVCKEIHEITRKKNPLFISLATGTTTKTISQWLCNDKASIIRSMPNIASAVGAGMTALFANDHASDAYKQFAESFFRSVGSTLWLNDESLINAITAVSGSGPAYLFYLFEAMQKAAESLGFNEADAKLLVSQTAIGAAKMVMESDQSFEQLRKMVTAEKGTTAAATQVLNEHQTQRIVKEAIEAALGRAKELTQ